MPIPSPALPPLRRLSGGLLAGLALASLAPPNPVLAAPSSPRAVTRSAPQVSPLSAAQVSALDALLTRPGTRVGAVVRDAASGAVLYSRHPTLPLTPASNMKLFSVLPLLYTLGPDYWFSTTVTRSGPGLSVDHLTLTGIGDPSLTVSTGEHSLAGLARQVRLHGVRTVGTLRIDGHMIDGAAFALPFQERPLTGLPLDEGSDEEGGQRVPQADAAYLRRVGELLRAELERAGVQVTGGVTLALPRTGTYSAPTPDHPDPQASADKTPPTATQRPALEARWSEQGVATTRSAPLWSLARFTLKQSDNLWAESLYARSGVVTTTPGWRPATQAQAQAAQARFLALARVPTAGLVLRDGSGLSTQDRLTAGAVAALLEFVYRTPATASGLSEEAGRAYRDRLNLAVEALPQAGSGTGTAAGRETGGTLAGRLGGQLRGQPLDVRAKTGTLPGVSSLSGYLTTAPSGGQAGRVLVFSLLMNRSDLGPAAPLRAVQDEAVRVLVGGAGGP